LLNGSFLVVIEVSATEQLHYLVANPHDFVSVGEAVHAGCPIGESIPVLRNMNTIGTVATWVKNVARNVLGLVLSPEALDGLVTTLIPASLPEDTGFTALMDYSAYPSGAGTERRLLAIYPNLIAYPEAEPRPCDYQPSACLTPGRELKQAQTWLNNGQVEFVDGGGVMLYPGGSIAVQLALDSATAYQAEVWARSMTAGQGEFAVQLGQTTASFTVGEHFQQSLLSAGVHAADLGLEYTFAVRNAGAAPLFVNSVCVSNEGYTSGPSQCYFANPSFEGLPGWNEWQTNGGVSDGLVPGELIMP
jgi:hypothetical protein